MDFSDSSENIFSKKNIIYFLLLAILTVAIPLGVRLVQQQQILRSQAAVEPITFSGTGVSNCPGANCQTTSGTNDITISSTLGPPP